MVLIGMVIGWSTFGLEGEGLDYGERFYRGIFLGGT